MNMHPYAIAIHGGAGTISSSSLPSEKAAAYRQGLADAIIAGENVSKKMARHSMRWKRQSACLRIALLECRTGFGVHEHRKK